MTDAQEKQLQFLAATYLECVSDELREEISNDILNRSYDDFQRDIEELTYEKLLHSFKTITNSDMVLMFQAAKGTTISSDTNYNQIVILAESDTERHIPILRSELLEFYRSKTTVLLLKESIKIVNVPSSNIDPTVVSYSRPPCTIVFIEFGYGAESQYNRNRIYFALFFKKENNSPYISISDVLPSVRNFLLYRFNLVDRINRDFKNNIYGIQKEELWKNQWLSIEKAGAHADSKLIDDIIDDSAFNHECINTLFFDDKISSHEKDNKNVLQLIANILIARYFRLIFSADPNLWRCYDHIDDSNSALNNILGLKYNDSIHFKSSEIPITFSKDLSYNWLMYYIKSNRNHSGLPYEIKTTYSKKYLVAFLVDIFNNVLKMGQSVNISIEQTLGNEPAFLVIKNSVLYDTVDEAKWSILSEKEKVEYCYMLNYKLKQSIEFENAYDQSIKKGISLGCLNHFMSYFGRMKVYYEYCKETVWYCIKLPIIKNK